MFEYNTSRKKLKFPEYGRSIQEMVDHVRTIEDREERNKAAKCIIDIMGSIQPHLRDINDFKHKLWDHLAIMSDFDLDIDFPYEVPTPASINTKPHPVAYPKLSVENKHYGTVIIDMIKYACTMEKGESRDHLVELIALYMKKSYISWNRDSVEDNLIIRDLEQLSGGECVVSEILKYVETKQYAPARNNNNNGKRKKRPPYHAGHKPSGGRNYGNNKKM